MLQLALIPLQTTGEELEIDPTIVLVSTLVLLLLSVAIGYWVYKDASKRDNNEVLWAITIAALLFLTLIFGIVALIAYVIFRGDETTGDPPQEGAASGEW